LRAKKNVSLSYKIQVLDRALDVLDSFTFENREMSLTEVVQKTGLNKTTVKRLLYNLTRRKYLQQDLKTRKYKLGLRLFELGGVVFSSFSLRKTASYYMEHFKEQTGSTILLGTTMENQLIYLDKREGNGMVRISSEIGWRRPLNYGMLGMVLLAYRNIDYVKMILREYPLKAYTPNSIIKETVFLNRLEKIRKQGYVIETGEAVEGVIGIAAPIRNHLNKVIAALGIALPISKASSKEVVDHLAKQLKSSCEEISANIGFKKIGVI